MPAGAELVAFVLTTLLWPLMLIASALCGCETADEKRFPFSKNVRSVMLLSGNGRGARSLVVVFALFTTCFAPVAAHADPDPTHDAHDPYFNEDEYTEFYTPPEPLPPGRPGDLIRTEPSRLVLEPSGQLGAIMATGTRIMYRSTDARGNPMAVTGTYFEPYNDWPGQGPRPLIVYGPGTQGQGDQCAPSRQFNQGIHWSPYLDLAFNYEELFVATMVARGFAIVMTDYQGLGTPGLHTYVNRVAEGDAMIDAGQGGDAVAGHVAGSAWAAGLLGLLAGWGSRRELPPSWRRRTGRSCTWSAPTRARRRPI